MVTGAEHVGKGQQRREERGVLPDGERDKGAAGLRDPHRLTLAAIEGVPPLPPVTAGRLQALTAELAGPVGPHERRHDDLTALQRGHVRADILNHAEKLVTHPVIWSALSGQ